jgi:hypothetical protein
MLKAEAEIDPPTLGYPLSLHLASLSQKWNVPSDPPVLNVPKTGWVESAFIVQIVMVLLTTGSRWHLKDMLRLEMLAYISYSRAGCALRLLIVNVLEGTSSFYTSNHESVGIFKAAHRPCLVLQRALHGLEEPSGIVEVHYVDVSLRRGNNQELVFHVHGIDPLLASYGGCRGGGSQIPVFNRLVPRARHNHRAVGIRNIHESNGADGCIMDGDLLGGSAVRREVEEFG